MLWRRWCSGRRRARPPARLGVLTSFGAAPRSPPVPSGPSGALHTGGAWLLMCGSACRLEARPGPATAHGHRSLAPPARTGTASRLCHRPRAPQRGPPGPPAPSTLAALGVSKPGQAPPPPPVPSVTLVKPSSPLLACALSSVKPRTPLRGIHTRFRRYFGAQRRRGFHAGVQRSLHWC